MKKFLVKASLFFILTLLTLSFILMNFGGYVDPFYEKFTVPKQTSMILGDSRSLQGIQPRIIDAELKDSGYDLPMFNYSFTIAQAHYGKPYTESVRKKLKTSKNGLFILSVHPWLFAEGKNEKLKSGKYPETDVPPHNMLFTNKNPNFEYFVRNYKFFNFRNLFRSSGTLHKDGWMEESNFPKDSVDMVWWKNRQIKRYELFPKEMNKSPQRISDFIAMITDLKKNGRIILVRMPVDPAFLKIETSFWGNFDDEIGTLSKKMGLEYFDFSKSDKYRTYDGNHLDKYVGAVFTKDLCDSIKTTAQPQP